MKSIRMYLAILAIALTAACAQLGVPTPKTFNERAFAAGLTIDSMQKTASTLLKANKITPADAENVLKAADVATDGIKVARSYLVAAPTSANSRLDAAVLGLTAITTYLATQGAK